MAPEISTAFINATILSSFAFLFLTWLMVHLSVKHLSLRDKKISKAISFSILIFLVAWFVVVFSLGKTGFFSRNELVAPYLFIGFIVLFGILQKLYYLKSIEKITDAIPQHWIIGIQTYRIVGYGFLMLYAQGLLPALFAFSAGIGDMIVGFSAPIVAYFVYSKKPFAKNIAIIWNYIGILDLVIAISIGIIGFPRPIQLVPLSPSTELLSLFPLVLIPLFAVPLAFFLHFCSLRALRKS